MTAPARYGIRTHDGNVDWFDTKADRDECYRNGYGAAKITDTTNPRRTTDDHR